MPPRWLSLEAAHVQEHAQGWQDGLGRTGDPQFDIPTQPGCTPATTATRPTFGDRGMHRIHMDFTPTRVRWRCKGLAAGNIVLYVKAICRIRPLQRVTSNGPHDKMADKMAHTRCFQRMALLSPVHALAYDLVSGLHAHLEGLAIVDEFMRILVVGKVQEGHVHHIVVCINDSALVGRVQVLLTHGDLPLGSVLHPVQEVRLAICWGDSFPVPQLWVGPMLHELQQ